MRELAIKIRVCLYVISDAVPVGKIYTFPPFLDLPELHAGQADEINALLELSPKYICWIPVNEVIKDWNLSAFNVIVRSHALTEEGDIY
jgi:hypothetical protein